MRLFKYFASLSLVLCLSGQTVFINSFRYQAAGGGGGNDLTFRSQTFDSASDSSSTPGNPSGAAANDIFIALAACSASGTITRPSGWTSIYSGSNASFDYDLCWIRRGGSAPDMTWNFGASVYHEVFVLAYSGCITSGSPVEASTDGGSTSTQTPNSPSVTTVNANSMVLSVIVQWSGSSGGWTAPASYTLRSNNTAGNDGGISERKIAVAGAEDPGAWDLALASALTWTSTISLQD